MVDIRLAGVDIRMDNRYPDLEEMCREYTADFQGEAPRIVLQASPEELAAEQDAQDGTFSDGYLETVCLYRKLALEILRCGVFVMHASVISVDGWGYGFLAASGVGKTTQTRMWLEHFGSRALVVNGDKPLIRMEAGTDAACRFRAYGTPWCGKEGMGNPVNVPLKALFFLRRSEEVTVAPATPEQCVQLLFRQLLMPEDPEQMELLLDMADKLVCHLPCYILGANLTEQSVIRAYQAANQEESR